MIGPGTENEASVDNVMGNINKSVSDGSFQFTSPNGEVLTAEPDSFESFEVVKVEPEDDPDEDGKTVGLWDQ